MEDAKLFDMMQELSEKFDMMIELLRKIESNTSATDSNTGDIYYVKSELEDANTNLRRVINKLD